MIRTRKKRRRRITMTLEDVVTLSMMLAVIHGGMRCG